jgi:anti-sigma factor RsiW
MTCSEFIEGFSEYVDGVSNPDGIEAARAHLEGCDSCRRYERTYRRGVSLLRSFSDLSVREGFEPDLERRLRRETALALENLGRRPVSSGSPMTVVLGMALILVGAAWSPFLFSGRVEVDLRPIRAAMPQARALTAERVEFGFPGTPRVRVRGDFAGENLWDEPSRIFKQYAPVMRGYATAGPRLGLD